MKDERDEKLTVEEIKERLRSGYQFYPTQPGLKEAARELIRPLVESLEGREIVYECRGLKLMRVDQLKTDANGFRARAITLHDLGCRIPTFAERVVLEKTFNGRRPTKEEWRAAVNTLPPDPKPLDFGADWGWLRLRGSAISMNMITDCFYPDPAVVAAVKAAVAQGNIGEVSAILRRAAGEE
ncbi:MAG: hypothetical protein IH623_12895 [Verrucomicrobia bacterium]|nr:hypothetical protein [Verrucomicrobiota bacterium]